MNYPQYKKVALVMFVVLTLLITGGAIFIGIKLSQTPSTAPEDSDALIPIGCYENAVGYCACETSSFDPSVSNCCSAPQTSGDSCSNEKNTNDCRFNTELIKFPVRDVGKMARCNYTANRETGIEWVEPSNIKCDCSAYIPEEYRDMPTTVIKDFEATVCIGNTVYLPYLATCENGYPYSCAICVPIAASTTPSNTPTETPIISIGTPSARPSATPTYTTTVTPSTGRISSTPTNTPTVTVTRTTTPTATRAVSTSTTPTTSVIPATALISDEVDVIILGFAFVFFGVALYKSGLYIKIGQVYWEGAGDKISSGLSQTNEGFLGFLDNIWAGLSHFDKTITYMFYQTKVRIRMGAVLIYNNLILIKEQIITSVLKLVSKILNLFLFITIKFKKVIRTIKTFFKALFKALFRSVAFSGKESIKTINKKIKRLPKNFEEKVIDDREEISE